jgi:predicted alpha/beta-fold hydrolase
MRKQQRTPRGFKTRISKASFLPILCSVAAAQLVHTHSWNIFHGARTSDAHRAALAVRRAVSEDQVLIGVGYSMGAIIMSNYVASYGRDCALDGLMAISGGLDMRYQEDFFRAQRMWQPMLAETLRDDFLLGKWGHRVKERLSHHDFLRMMRASHVTVSSMP